MLAILLYILHGMFNYEISLWYTMLIIFDKINSLFGCKNNQEGSYGNNLYSYHKLNWSRKLSGVHKHAR